MEYLAEVRRVPRGQAVYADYADYGYRLLDSAEFASQHSSGNMDGAMAMILKHTHLHSKVYIKPRTCIRTECAADAEEALPAVSVFQF